MKLHIKYLRFLEFLLFSRSVSGYLNGLLLETRSASRGLPQKSVFSPILYNIYTSFLFDNLLAEVKYLAYADDIVLYSTSQRIQIIYKNLNLALKSINQELTILKLKLFCEKSKFCLFSQKNHRKMIILFKNIICPRCFE